MKNYLVMAAGAVVLLALVVWLIRREGDRFRKGLRDDMKQSAQEVIKEGADHVVEKTAAEAQGVIDTAADSAGRVIDKAADAPGHVLRDMKSELEKGPGAEEPAERTRARSDGSVSDRPSEDKATTSETGTGSEAEPAGGRPAIPTIGQTGEPSNEEAKPQTAEEKSAKDLNPVTIVGDLFEFGRAATKTVDEIGQEVLALSLEEEIKAGKDVHAMLANEYKLLDRPSALRRIEKLAEPLMPHCSRKGIHYTFHIIDDEEVNAFSHLGGYIYVNNGLLGLAKTDAELQFVLGHEMAHVDLKHCVKKLTYAAQASKVSGEAGASIVQLAYQAISLGYSEDNEYEADAWAYRRLRTLGRTRVEALSFPRHMREHFRDKGINDDEQKTETVTEAGIQEIQNHFRSHPPTRQRIERLEKLEP